MINKIAKEVDRLGGRAYYVGGYVRDKLLGKENKDIDIELHSIEPKDFVDILQSFDIHTDLVGQQFGVYKAMIGDTDIDFSFPRTESKSGSLHTDFDVTVDPYLGLEKATLRRDFTINALMEDVLTGEILDFHGGIDDLHNRTIRHVSDKFIEDPLRVFRAAQFASRFNFHIADETKELCKSIPVNDVAFERVFVEFEKAMTKSSKPSKFFTELMPILHEEQKFFTEINMDEITEIDSYSRDNYIGKVLLSVAPNTYGRLTRDRHYRRYVNSHKDVDYDVLMYGTYLDALEIVDDVSTDVFDIARVKLDMNPKRIEYLTSLLPLKEEALTGVDLISLGYKPGPEIKEMMRDTRRLAFQGISKREITEIYSLKLDTENLLEL